MPQHVHAGRAARPSPSGPVLVPGSSPRPFTAEEPSHTPVTREASALGHDFSRVRVESPGSPLPHPLRREMESAFRHDFSWVRVRESDRPRAAGADALAHGEQIEFAPGAYRPTDPAGRELIGHELTHVVQQRAGRVAAPRGAIHVNPGLEAEAEALGARAARGEAVTVPGASGARAFAGDGAALQPGKGKPRTSHGPEDDSETEVKTPLGNETKDPFDYESKSEDEGSEDDPEPEVKDKKPKSRPAPKKSSLDFSKVAEYWAGAQAGRGSRSHGIVYRPPRSYNNARESQVAKHITTLLRMAGKTDADRRVDEEYKNLLEGTPKSDKDREKALKNKAKSKGVPYDPIEVQVALLRGNVLLATNSTTATKNLADLVKKAGGAKKLMKGVQAADSQRKKGSKKGSKSSKRFQEKLQKVWSGERKIRGADKEDVKRAKQMAEIFRNARKFTSLDPSKNPRKLQKALENWESGGNVYVVPGERHAELNLAEFRYQHLKSIQDPRARTYGSKRNCATCHGEMKAKYPEMASGQLPGLFFATDLEHISPEGQKEVYKQLKHKPSYATQLQGGGKGEMSTASDSDTDAEGKPIKKPIPLKKRGTKPLKKADPQKVTGKKKQKKSG